MVRTYKRKKPSVVENLVRLALGDIENGTKLLTAAKKYGVSLELLRVRMKSRNPTDAQRHNRVCEFAYVCLVFLFHFSVIFSHSIRFSVWNLRIP